MGARTAKMPKDVGVVATGFFKGIGKHGKACGVKFARRQGALFVSGWGERDHARRKPGGVGRHRAEWVAEDVTQQVSLTTSLTVKNPSLNHWILRTFIF